MATVIIEFQIRVVDDEVVKKLFEKTVKTGDDLVEVPDLPGMTWNDVIGMSKGRAPLDIIGLQNRVDAALLGDVPTAVMFVRKGDAIDLRKS